MCFSDHIIKVDSFRNGHPRPLSSEWRPWLCETTENPGHLSLSKSSQKRFDQSVTVIMCHYGSSNRLPSGLYQSCQTPPMQHFPTRQNVHRYKRAVIHFVWFLSSFVLTQTGTCDRFIPQCTASIYISLEKKVALQSRMTEAIAEK